ncbi:hypothetical protein RJ640_001723 [Escallonia rubra]|uniref:Retrotransposon gag domain-containing protein n=1 Tax=Escallonia rubra TaxID=112253 RepID=A0AA88QIL7_9ASTE|nr:hypothetical protein RJ640_001723 [Escallonia rubra]
MQAIENTSKSAAARSGSSSTSTGPVTRSRARDEIFVPNQVVVPVSKPPVKPRVQFREVMVSRYEKDKVSGSKVPHLELEENTLHQMPPPSFQYASDVDSSTGSQSGSSPESPKHLVSSPRSESHTFAPPVTMQVMMTGSMSIEEQLATMSRAFEKLTKTVEEKDFQIATLMNKLELQANEESNRDEVNETSKKGGANGRHDESTFDGIEKEDRSNSVASLSVQQLQDMITSTIRAQYGGPSRNNLMYSKPYTKRIDNMRMPTGYQPPKFQQFDGKGNPKQHVAHFVETCNNAGTEGDLLVKQFVRSLKGNAFDWYTDIEPESIDCWEAMEREFLNRFYSTRRSVSMMELTNTRQLKYELVVDYINRWRSLSLDCKERLSEISAVEMCMQGMHWGLLYILQGNRPTSFEELATRAHDMEISIANHGGSSPALPDPRKVTREGKKVERSSKMTGKESLAITTAPLKVPKKDKHKEEKAPEHLREKPRQQPSLKELEGKVYPFPDSDVPGILDFLLEKGIIELPESKRLEESGRANEPRYCKYHRILGHKTEKCFILKELIMNLAKKGKIELDIDGVEESNHASAISSDVTPSKGPNTLNNILTTGARMMTIQFGMLDPVKVQLIQKMSEASTQADQLVDTDDGGWTPVTRRKPKKQPVTPLQLFRQEKRQTKKGKQQCRKGRRHAAKKSCKEVDEGFRQEIPKSITLEDFFPSGYLKDDAIEIVWMVSVHEDEHDSDEETIDENNESMLIFLRGLPLRFTLQEMLDLPQSTHEVLKKESPVFRYVPVSRRAEGQSPFVELVELKEVKVERVPKTGDVHVLKEELTIPLTTIGTVKLPLKGFVEPSRGMAKNPHPPSVKTYEGFDAKAQKLFKNSGYDFENPVPLGELSPELTGEKVHGLNETQKKLRQQGHRVSPPRMGVGYKPDRPIRVPLKSKQNRVSIKYITADEVDESGDEQVALPRTSVFDRIQTSPSLNQGETSSSDQSSRTSAFKRLGVTTLNKNKIDSTRRPRASIFSRLGGQTGKIDDKNSKAIAEMEARHKEDKETRSLVPSRMKRKTKIDVSNDGILKAKRRTIVITGQETDAISVRVVEVEDWRQPLIDYLEHGRLPEDIRHKTEIRRRAPRFIYYKDTMFRRSYEGLFLRY